MSNNRYHLFEMIWFDDIKRNPTSEKNLDVILSISSRFWTFQIVCNFGCVKSMTLLVNVSIFFA